MDLNDRVYEFVRAMVFEQVGLSPNEKRPADHDALEEYGIGSATFIKLVVRIEREFGIEFEDRELDFRRFGSIMSITEYVRELQG